MADLLRIYDPPGPVARAFMNSRGRVRLLMGPIGSGKTSACLWAMIWTALEQPAHPLTRVRRFSFACIRNTYRDLERTTIPSWLIWFPKTMGRWTGGTGGAPGKHELTYRLSDGTLLSIVAHFIGLGDQTVEQACRGMEVTAFYLNEADLLSSQVLEFVNGRVGRDPPVDRAANFPGASWVGVLLDCNAPDVDNWIYKTFVERLPEGFEFFRQPSGLSPAAENLQNIRGGGEYYRSSAASASEDYVRRMIRNEFGYSRDGKPVYPEFADQIHVAAAPLDPNPDLPLILGFDAGLTPAAVFCQQTASGQWRILDELCVVEGTMGAKRFAEEINRVLGSKFARCGRVSAWVDPAAGAMSSTDEKTWAETVSASLNLRLARAPSNALQIRLEAVRQTMAQIIDGQPGFVLSPQCRHLRKGFNSGYRFRRMQLTGENRYADTPEKNDFSHVQDALQYAILGGGGYAQALGRKAKAMREGTRVLETQGYDPFSWQARM